MSLLCQTHWNENTLHCYSLLAKHLRKRQYQVHCIVYRHWKAFYKPGYWLSARLDPQGESSAHFNLPANLAVMIRVIIELLGCNLRVPEEHPLTLNESWELCWPSTVLQSVSAALPSSESKSSRSSHPVSIGPVADVTPSGQHPKSDRKQSSSSKQSSWFGPPAGNTPSGQQPNTVCCNNAKITHVVEY